jgi:hypothetical protein
MQEKFVNFIKKLFHTPFLPSKKQKGRKKEYDPVETRIIL